MLSKANFVTCLTAHLLQISFDLRRSELWKANIVSIAIAAHLLTEVLHLCYIVKVEIKKGNMLLMVELFTELITFYADRSVKNWPLIRFKMEVASNDMILLAIIIIVVISIVWNSNFDHLDLFLRTGVYDAPGRN